MEAEKTNQIARWLVNEGLRGTPEKELIEGFCEKLGEAGFPLMRGSVIQRTLHPVIAGHGFEWNDDGNGVIQESWQRAVDETGRDWGKSPFYHMLSGSIPKMREHLAKTNEPSAFPLINKLRERGATDYLAYVNPYAEHDKFGDAGGMISSWTARGGEGFTDEQVDDLGSLISEHHLSGVLAPNFSIGAVLLTKLAQMAAPYFDHVAVTEEHHETKVDAPSGTAMAIARALHAGHPAPFNRNVPEREPLAGTLGGEYEGISVHSLRMPGRMAHHQVTFGGPGQTLTLRHDTINRECYMPGVLLAIRRVGGLHGLTVGLDHLMDL